MSVSELYLERKCEFPSEVQFAMTFLESEVRLNDVDWSNVQEALYAPSYAWNADVLIYVTKGNGRIQITGSEEQLLDSDVREGSLVVVPQFHPDIIKASKNGLEFVAIATSDQ